MERILIIEGNGCGKTTFSKILCDKLKLPLIHLDVLYWRDNWKTASKYEFDELLMQDNSFVNKIYLNIKSKEFLPQGNSNAYSNRIANKNNCNKTN